MIRKSICKFVSKLSSETFTFLVHSSTGSSGSKKSVRFSEVVHRQVFRSNSSILGRKVKNTKKAEQKKRRAVERRASEGDADQLSGSSGDGIHKAGSWMNMRYATSPPQNNDDSGMASSVEDSFQMSNKPKGATQSKSVAASKTKPKTSQTKKKLTSASSGQGQFLKEANPDLIFDLDF